MNRMFCVPEDLLAQVDLPALLEQADMDALPPPPEPPEPPQSDEEAEGETPVNDEEDAAGELLDTQGEARDVEDVPDVLSDGDVGEEEVGEEEAEDPDLDPEAETDEPPKHDTITPAIANASAEISGYLRRRYSLPETPDETPATLRKLCIDIAIYNVFSRRGFAFGKDDRDLIIEKRYERAVAYLMLVAQNKLDIDGLKTAGAEDEEGIEDGSGGAHIPLYRA